jgi:hypothetical protein
MVNLRLDFSFLKIKVLIVLLLPRINCLIIQLLHNLISVKGVFVLKNEKLNRKITILKLHSVTFYNNQEHA